MPLSAALRAAFAAAVAASVVFTTDGAHADPVKQPSPPPAVVVEAPTRQRALEWKPEWARAHATDYVVTGVGLAAALTFAILPPQNQHAFGGVLFDDAVRNAIRLPTYDGRHAASDTSDVFLSILIAYPTLFDAFALGYGYWRSADATYQMTVINAETLALAAGVQGAVNFAVSRERPYGSGCGTESDMPAGLGECTGPSRYRSFFSGHATISFASAGLTCMHHLNLHLFGGAADAIACVATLALAGATSVLRVAADAHYTTDVVTGSLVGTALGFGIPAFHYAHRHRKAPTAFEWHVAPSLGGIGLGVGGTW